MVLAPIFFLSVIFYFWTGTTEGNPTTFGTQTDPYNLLANAFLKGHLGLLEPVPPGLLALKDPYDPAQNAYWQEGIYHDLALYKGHFFLTWGPTPVVTLLIPWRLLGVGDMPMDLGVIIYCSFGLLFAFLLLCLLVDRYLPDTKVWQIGFASAALALSSVAPYLLRRPSTYELAISSAYCFGMMGAYFLASGGLSPSLRLWKLAVGSASIGLAVGGRPDLVFEALLLIVLFAYIVRKRDIRTRAEFVRYANVLLVPFLILFVLDLAYNYARFGSLLQNGTTYALVGGVEVSKLPMFSLSSLLPNLYYYAIAPVRWTLAFPYFTLPPPPYGPGNLSLYYGVNTGGLVTTTPIVVACIPALVSLARQRRRELLVLILTVLAFGTLILFFLSVVLPSSTERYEVDYATFFVISGLIGWFVLSSGRKRRVVAAVGALLILYGCAVGTAISIYGYFDALRTSHPATYWTIDRLTSPFPTAWTMITGHPEIVRAFPAGQGTPGNGGTYDLSKLAFELSGDQLEVDIISPSSGQWALAPTFIRARNAGSGPISIVVQEDNGSVHYVPLGSGPTAIPLTLRRGLNRVELNATAASPAPTSDTLAYANGLRLTRN